MNPIGDAGPSNELRTQREKQKMELDSMTGIVPEDDNRHPLAVGSAMKMDLAKALATLSAGAERLTPARGATADD